ncbi:hypothetical protein CYMTET_30517, partial [Cymbomonas tetramitiformis]
YGILFENLRGTPVPLRVAEQHWLGLSAWRKLRGAVTFKSFFRWPPEQAPPARTSAIQQRTHRASAHVVTKRISEIQTLLFSDFYFGVENGEGVYKPSPAVYYNVVKWAILAWLAAVRATPMPPPRLASRPAPDLRPRARASFDTGGSLTGGGGAGASGAFLMPCACGLSPGGGGGAGVPGGLPPCRAPVVSPGGGGERKVFPGAFTVPCACETGDDQPWECTWPQTLGLTLLFSLQLGFLLKYEPLHNAISQRVELLTCVCNLAIVGSVLLSWWNLSFRDVLMDGSEYLFLMQVLSLMMEAGGAWYMILLRLRIWYRVRYPRPSEEEMQEAAQGKEQRLTEPARGEQIEMTIRGGPDGQEGGTEEGAHHHHEGPGSFLERYGRCETSKSANEDQDDIEMRVRFGTVAETLNPLPSLRQKMSNLNPLPSLRQKMSNREIALTIPPPPPRPPPPASPPSQLADVQQESASDATLDPVSEGQNNHKDNSERRQFVNPLFCEFTGF